MPKTTMFFALKILQQNSKHNFVVASKHATSFWGAFQFHESGAHECKHPRHLHNKGARTFDHQYQMASSINMLHFHMQPKQGTTAHYDVHK
jgi:hypothetical protein